GILALLKDEVDTSPDGDGVKCRQLLANPVTDRIGVEAATLRSEVRGNGLSHLIPQLLRLGRSVDIVVSELYACLEQEDLGGLRVVQAAGGASLSHDLLND